MDLATFDRELRAIAGDAAVRPFLCKGSPFDCQVFLVGINPGTDLPLWPYWSVEHGCNKEAWLDAYKQKEGRLRPTRKRIELLCDALEPVRALETNVFHHRSWREAELAREYRKTEVFDFLMERLAPRVIFVHGRSAVEHLQSLTRTEIKHEAFTRVSYNGISCVVYAGHHLSYRWSYAKVEQVGHELRARCST